MLPLWSWDHLLPHGKIFRPYIHKENQYLSTLSTHTAANSQQLLNKGVGLHKYHPHLCWASG